MLDAKLIINQQKVSASDGAVFERRNPITGEVVTVAAAATVADAEAAASAAAAAFPAWSATGPSERRELLLKVESLFIQHTDEIIAVMEAELGAAPGWSHFNIHLTTGLVREAAVMTTQLSGEVIPSDIPGLLTITTRRPVGVVLGIAPWNGPIILGARSIAMALACGNTVVMKGSELCPATHALVASIFVEAGFPAGVVNFINNAPKDASDIVSALIAHPAIKRINFTGSTAVGRIIATKAAQHLKPCLLELGGKAPFVVLDDADLNDAVNAANFGAFMNQGQICMSTERVIVDNKIADDFVARFIKKAEGMAVGDPRKSDAPLGSMASTDAPAKLNALITDAVEKGAVLALGGTCDSTLFSPTILDHVTPAMRIYKEESFGPIASIIRFDDIEEALTIANDTDYGLTAAVFGRDIGRAMAFANRIDSGARHVNQATIHDQPQIPFGGVKHSGYGRFNGKESIYEFTDTCVLTVRSTPGQYPF